MKSYFYTDVNYADLSTWSAWYEWAGGDCPIPWAKKGQYQLGMKSHLIAAQSDLFDAMDREWHHGKTSYGESLDIIAYRYDMAANPGL